MIKRTCRMAKWSEEIKELTFPQKMLVWDNDKGLAKQLVVIDYVSETEYPWIVKSFKYKNAEELLLGL